MLYHILRITCLCTCLWLGGPMQAQAPRPYSSGELYEAIHGLRVLGCALYIAAHPDDENTRLISHLVNDQKMHTTYLSMTRGDGGQNLIGSEISELLGVIRTQELLQARRTDHGYQLFTRANDFGFSKTPEETLAIWDEKEITADVVWAIRKLQPDVIINRFMTESRGGNHGHHTASAILSSKAFELAADPSAFSDQLSYVSPWKTSRLFMNTSWWFYGSREKFEEVDKSRMTALDVGLYNKITGISNSEIAARSRTMHKSQGFGSTPSRGTEMEYLELLEGEMPADKSNIFEGINTTWSRVSGGAHIDKMLIAIEDAYDFQNPEKSAQALLYVRQEIQNLSPSVWKTRKLRDIDEIIVQAIGMYVEANAANYYTVAGDSVQISCEVTQRADVPAQLLKTEFLPSATDLQWSAELGMNMRNTTTRNVKVPSGHMTTAPYWLKEPFSIGRYTVDDQMLRGLPETPHDIAVRFTFRIYDKTFDVEVPVVFKETDPVKGEVYRPFEIVPPAFVNIQAPVYIFNGTEDRQVQIVVRAAKDSLRGQLRINSPAGWTVTPQAQDVHLNAEGDEHQFFFSLTPTENAVDGVINGELTTLDGTSCTQMLTEINYDHIPAQTVLRRAMAKVIHIDLKSEGQRIAYLHGAGDDVAASLQRIGYSVDILNVEDITSKEMLQRYDAIVLGIRAYNTLDRLRVAQDFLFGYVEDGGTLVTQYNTTSGLVSDRLAPFNMEIGRKRVTDEKAKVTFVNPDHPALNYPNKLTEADFVGWVQERGLYYADTWDVSLEPLLSMSDPGEDANEGALLVAKYGQGYFVYTSLSFFRQLPEGVPGAYRLFANLLALGQNGKS